MRSSALFFQCIVNLKAMNPYVKKLSHFKLALQRVLFKPLLLLIVLLGLWGTLMTLIGFGHRQAVESFFVTQIDSFNNQKDAILNTYELFSDYIFQGIIQDPQVLQALADGNSEDVDQQSIARHQLLDKLSGFYEALLEYNFRQLHFHLPDGRSFLRFHAPETYGDSLWDVRDSIRLVNTELRPIQGFEEGRIFNGYRYLFPLFIQDQHIGSVEISVSLGSLIEVMNGIDPGRSTFFLLKRSVVTGLVFDDQQYRYGISPLSSDYLYDREVQAISYDNCFCNELVVDDIQSLLSFAGPKVETNLEE